MNEKNTVKCVVTDCAFNKQKMCTATGIHIGGEQADNADATCCETFRPSGNMVNSCGCSIGGGTEIRCDAMHCKHNNDCHCMLSGIDVNCGCSGCDCKTSGETYCASFAK